MLRDYFRYDPDTGLLIRLKCYFKSKVGKPVPQSINNHGYCVVKHDGTTYSQHRLAWYLHTGQWPGGEIDHKDGDKTNNKWENLRECNHSEQMCNRTSRGSMPKGVFQNGSGYAVRVTKDGERHYLGTYKDLAEAEDKAKEARILFHKNYVKENI